MSVARYFVYHTPNPTTGRSFLEYDELTKDKFTFMASTKIKVDSSFYQLPDQIKLPQLAINVHLGYVGGASLNSVAELVDKDTGFVFAQNTNQVVVVDKTTRKPTLVPEWWKERYVSHVIGGEKLVVGLMETPSEERFHTLDLKVSWNDIDGYKHTNYIAYIRFCFDAAMDAVSKGFFSKLSDDILLYPVKKMEISYKGESVANDELTVKCWESDADPFLIHFDISRDGKTLFQNSIEFFAPKL